MRSRNPAILTVLIALAVARPANAQVGPLKDPIPFPIPQSPIQVSLKPVVTGLGSPIDLKAVSHKGDQQFIVDQKGLVLAFKDGAPNPRPILDLTGVIAQIKPAFPGAPQGLNPGYDERGLLGLAFHPGFADRHSPGYLTLYTLHNVPITRVADFVEPPFPNASVVPNCQEVIAEWRMSDDHEGVVIPGSYREILRFDRPQFNHNGGTVAFGPDGLLYAAFGDGGAANDVGAGHNPVTGNAQDLTTILGKMIRLNPVYPRLTSDRDGALSANRQYRIPRDNPFFSQAGAVKEIWAYGFRNPFRFSFDVKTGQLVLADVGQNNIEEVDIVTRGGNYGWNKQEGTFLFDPKTGNVFTNPKPDPSLINPIAEYDHFEATANAVTRIAIVGGFVYRGSKIHQLKGKYVCADLNGFLFSVDPQTGSLEQLLNAGVFIKGFGQDADNEIYLTVSTIEGPGAAGSTNGSVWKIVPVHDDQRDDDR